MGNIHLSLLILRFIGHCSLARKYREKDSPTHAASNSRSPFPHFCTKKLSRTCCTCSRGGSLFLPYPIQLHPLSPLIMVRLKMTSLETFQSNMIKNTTKRYVDCNAVSWFSSCRYMTLDSCRIPYSLLQIFVALCLHERSTDFTHSSVRHFGFTIEFYGQRQGDSLVQFSFLSHLFFSVYISFVNCKCCSLVLF